MPRTERCLWLGYRLASFDRWISFDRQLKQFFVKPLAVELEKSAKYPTIFGQASRSSGQTGNPMMDVPKPMVPV
ncbi:hypothetical protein AJ80_07564 [Polytolypa hystricis UAMH7299]|uniref:Uncharacterized protein n=1 Tax=Polytolypa hystricis (strain UAMH7299) TaxID=1447883 RepID=A0A2B7XEM8_POLH7|nr:hypothetical protein AJ80_07564 [Polytolypa hystricis UAMH7299]